MMDHFPINDPYDNESQETAPEKSCDNRKLKGHLQDQDSESLLVSNLGKSRQPTLVGGSWTTNGWRQRWQTQFVRDALVGRLCSDFVPVVL